MRRWSQYVPGTYAALEVNLSHAAYGIAIGARSEVDQCWIASKDSQPPAFLPDQASAVQGAENVITYANAATHASGNDYAPQEWYPVGNAALGIVGQAGLAKISMQRPLVAVLPPGQYLVGWTRRTNIGGGVRSPMIELEIADVPSEVAGMFSVRAPLDVGGEVTCDTNSQNTLICVMGRKLVTVDAYYTFTDGGDTITYTITGHKFVWDKTAGGARDVSVTLASGVLAVLGDTIKYDGDVGPIDYIEINWAAGANHPRAVYHVTAED